MRKDKYELAKEAAELRLLLGLDAHSPINAPLIEEVYRKMECAKSSKDKTKDDGLDFIYVMDNFIDKDFE